MKLDIICLGRLQINMYEPPATLFHVFKHLSVIQERILLQCHQRQQFRKTNICQHLRVQSIFLIIPRNFCEKMNNFA